MLSGKTTRILNRFPDFYISEDPRDLLHQWVDILGVMLDRTEADLTKVLRSRFIDSAESMPSQDFLGTQKGDLDRIFALYLERLGGTSQLSRINQFFQESDLKQCSDLVKQLVDRKTALTDYLWNAFPSETQAALKCYEVTNARFSGEFSAAFVIKLITGRDCFTTSLFDQFEPETQAQLNQYDGSIAIPIALKRLLAQDLNRSLKNRALFDRFQDYVSQIQLAPLIQDLNQSASFQAHHIAFVQTIRKRLSLPIQKQLLALTDPISTISLESLLPELIVLLSDRYFITSLLEATPTDGLELSQSAIATILKAALEAITILILGTNPTSLTFTLPIPPAANVPRGEDLERFNRLLLEAVYPGLITPSCIPSEVEIQHTLKQALNTVLQDAQLYQQNQAEFRAFTLTDEAESLIAANQIAPENLPRLNRLLLEAAFPTQLERRNAPYRDRLLRLISVLKTGASTKEGIVNIVAANLGINITDPNEVRPWEAFLFDLSIDSEESLASLTASPKLRQAFIAQGTLLSYSATVAMDQPQRRWTITDINTNQVYVVRKQANRLSVHRQFIRVIEFLPEPQSHTYPIHPRSTAFTEDSTFPNPSEFSITNPNPLPTVPAIELKLRDCRPPSERTTHLSPLTNIRIVNQDGQFVQYTNTLNCDDVLLFLPDGTILVNGKVWRMFTADGNVLINGQFVDRATPELISRTPPLSLNQSSWHVEAFVGYACATFEQTLFDASKFEQISLDPINPVLASSYVFEVDFSFYRLTPGSFLVKIPWDIPGYTDQFDNTNEHPRHQIHQLIDRVRAAGVRSIIAYEKIFYETQEMEANLSLIRSPFQEDHDLEEHNFDVRSQQKPYANGIEHEMTDTLITSAAFDYSQFDSMNMFG